MPSNDDEELDILAVQASAGEVESFTRIVVLTQDALRWHLASMGGQTHMIDEALQEAYLLAFRKLAQYQGPGSLRPWLKVIARNCLRGLLRDEARFRTQHGDILATLVADDVCERIDADTEQTGLLDRLNACVERLSPTGRQLLQRHYQMSNSLSDIASAAGRSEAWARVTLFRVRAQLRICLDGNVV